MSRVTIFFRRDRIIVEPNTVYLNRGEYLNWDIRVDQELRFINRFRWEIYFPERSPFSFGRTKTFQIETRSFETKELSAGSADVSGEYKYGVRLVNASSDETIYDEDPYIIVR